MQDMQAEVDLIIAATPWVGHWLNWMSLMLVLSVLFLWKHVPARWVFGSILAIVPTAVTIFRLSGNVNLVGLSHLIFWPPLCWYLVTKVIRQPDFKAKSPYGVWLLLVTGTMLVSLVFDVYDVTMVIIGQK